MNKYFFILILQFLIYSQLSAQPYEFEHEKLSINDKKLNCEMSILYPVIKNPNDEVQASFNVMSTFLIESKKDTFISRLSEMDSSDYTSEYKSYYNISDSVFFADERFISVLYYEDFYFSGAAHPSNSNFSLNYDLKLGKTLKLNDLFYGSFLNKFSEICRNELTKQFGMDKPDDWIIKGTEAAENNYEVFSLTKTHITITFQTYQVASYVAGASTVEINYSDIKDYINTKSVLSKFVK